MTAFEAVGPVLVRVALGPRPDPAADTPDPTPLDREVLLQRIESLLADPLLVEAVALASPATTRTLRRPLEELPTKRLRALALSLTAYDTRLRTRATPFGLFAGVTLASVGAATTGEVAGPAEHRKVVQPDAAWLDAVVRSLVAKDEGLLRLEFARHPGVRREGGQVLVDAATPGARTVRLSAIAPVLEVLAAPGWVIGAELVDLAARHTPDRDQACRVVRTLVAHGLLTPSLAPDPHDASPLDHVLAVLRGTGVGPAAVPALEGVRDAIEAYAAAPAGAGTSLLEDVVVAVGHASDVVGVDHPEGSPVHVDSVLSATVTIGAAVLDEAAEAARVLARLAGSREQQVLRDRIEQIGGGMAVPLRDLTADGEPAPVEEALAVHPDLNPALNPALARAHAAALRDGRAEIELDDDLLAELSGPDHPDDSGATELDLVAVLVASDAAAVDRGEFELHLRRPATSSAGATIGRFAPALGPDGLEALSRVTQRADRAAVAASGHPEGSVIVADLTFTPRVPSCGNVVRSPLTRPTRLDASRIPAAAEGGEGPEGLAAEDLVVAPGPSGPDIWSVRDGSLVLPRAASSLTTEAAPPATHTLAAAAGHNLAIGWHWGPLGRSAWLPRVRRGRVVLSPQTWRLDEDLVGSRTARDGWGDALDDWRHAWSVPDRVVLAEGDRQVCLHLDDAVDRELLRREARSGAVTLLETLPANSCWLRSADGAHAAEVVVSLVREPGGPSRPRCAPEVLPAAPTPSLPGEGWLRLCLPDETDPVDLVPVVNAVAGGRPWFVSRPPGGGLEIVVSGGDDADTGRLVGALLPPRLRAPSAGTGAGTGTGAGAGSPRAALVIQPYLHDAGFGHRVPDPQLLVGWAVADTLFVGARTCDDATSATRPMADLLGVVDLVRAVRDLIGLDLLDEVEPDRPAFAALRREILPLLASTPEDGHSSLPAEAVARRRGEVALYLRAAPSDALAAGRARLLLRDHARRVARPGGSDALLGLAAAALRALALQQDALRRSA